MTTRYTAHTTNLPAGYYDRGVELSEFEVWQRLNEQDAEVGQLRAERDQLRMDMQQANEIALSVEEKARKEFAALRAELASAHEHVGALVAAIDELDSLGEWIWSEADDKTLLSIYLTEAHHTELTDLMLAARDWLRRAAQ